MKVDKGRMIYDIIGKDRIQYTIPVYQRNYDWTKIQCEKLFNDIIECVRTNQQHFIGSIVNAQVSSNNKIFRYVIIDGQQRMTSIFLLLKALYDMSTNELDKQKISNWLFNEDRYDEFDLSDETKLKLKPIKSDNIQLSLLMNNKLDEMDKSSNIYRNYEFFKTKIEQMFAENFTVRNICDGLESLICAIITLEENDKPQEVFESINSTGQPLTISDLIRNFVLMTDEKQDQLFENYWVKIEQLISKDFMPSFIIDYLNFKSDGFVKESSAYESFKQLFINGKFTNESMLAELLKYAEYYHYFLQGSNKLSQDVNDCLDGLRQIKQTTIYVFLFSVFDDYFVNRIIDEKVLADILRFFLNYSIRRIVCNVPSNSLRALYKYLYARLFTRAENKEYYFETILSYFYQLQNTKDALVKDDDLTVNLLKGDLYHKNVICKYILYKMENHGSKEIVDVKNLTIEHIMPQNEFLSQSWKNMLGENWNNIHSMYLHTLGNLTLTGYNSELSDKSFIDKKQLLEKANTKIVLLNKDVLTVEQWDETTIKNRATRLGNLFKDIFYIASKPEVLISFKDESYSNYSLDSVDDATGLKPNSYTLEGEVVDIDNFKSMLDSVMKKLYERDANIMERIAKDNHPLIAWSKKPHISYDKSLLILSEQLGDTGIFYEINLSAPSKLEMIKGLLNEYDIDPEDFSYSARKSKTTRSK